MTRIPRITPATVIACIALAVALSGTSYAAFVLPADSVTSKQVKNHSIRRADIGRKALASLTGVPGPQGPAGPRGPAGPAGPQRPVTGADVTDNSLTGSDIAESTLGTVPNADTLDGFDFREFARTDRASVGLDLPTIFANSCINKLITISKLRHDDGVMVNPPGNFPLGLVLTATADINNDTLQELRVCNVTNGALDAPPGGFLFTLFRP
jgi:hypothetical protein